MSVKPLADCEMITEAKVRYWLKRRHLVGLPDRLDPQRDPLSYDEWIRIEEVAARLSVISRGLTSSEFEQRTVAEFSDQFTPQAIELLRMAPQVG